MAALTRSAHASYCPYKGEATYFSVKGSDGLIADVAMIVMITSGWGIYNDYVIITACISPARCGWATGRLRACSGISPACGCLALNGLAYLVYGLVTGRLRERLLPIRPADSSQTVRETLHFKIAHEDLTIYNAVQKLLYIVVILAGISQVVTGLAIWKPVQFSGLVVAAGRLPEARVIHFLGMAVIVGFLVVHVRWRCWCRRPSGPCWPVAHASAHPGTAKPEPGHEVALPPRQSPDPAILDDHRPLIRSLERRGLIRGGLSLGALTMLTGCDVDAARVGRGALLADLAAERQRAGARCSTRTSWRRPIRPRWC